jgi:hypothetical protein
MRRFRLRLAVPGLLLATVGLAFAFSSGPPASYTGAISIGSFPRENNCTLCHSTNPLNTPVGGIQIQGIPAAYVPGASYALTVQLSSDRTVGDVNRRWGFELTAIRADDGQGTGTFTLLDADTKQVPGGGAFAGRTYVEHMLSGIRQGQSSPATWQVQWNAPNQPAPYRVYFFAAGNAANGNGSSVGDFIYTTVDSSTVDVTPTLPVTWGQVKSRYRP